MTALYLHLPFCRVHCSYCPFAVSTDIRLQDRYIAALEREIAMRARDARLESVYFGGGTPSRISADAFDRIVSAIREKCDLSALGEVTLEANPEDVTPEAIERWREGGVNRLSIGVQSLHDGELYPLGRGHSRDVALRALTVAAESGIRLNADLIIGLPGQTLDSFDQSLRELLGFGVGHLSLYMLDLEEGTALERQVSRNRVQLPPDEATAAAYLRAIEVTRELGLEQYEISNFARPGEESQHNLRYWRRLPYIGVGMSAHSFDGAKREGNTREIQAYVERLEGDENAVVFEEQLTAEEIRHEELFLHLRQARGIEVGELLRLTSGAGEEWSSRGIEEGWLARNGDRVAFTPSGFLLSNDYISELF